MSIMEMSQATIDFLEEHEIDPDSVVFFQHGPHAGSATLHCWGIIAPYAVDLSYDGVVVEKNGQLAVYGRTLGITPAKDTFSEFKKQDQGTWEDAKNSPHLILPKYQSAFARWEADPRYRSHICVI